MSSLTVLTPKDIEVIKAGGGAGEMLIALAQNFAVITTTEEEAKASEFRSQLKLRQTESKAAHARLVKPLKDHAKQIEADIKKAAGPIEEADEIVKNGMIAYRNSENVRLEKQHQKELEYEAKQAMAEGDITALEIIARDHAESRDLVPKTIQTETGGARFRKVWHFEITDQASIPDEYWIVDESKIRKVVSAGVEIAGVKSWSQDEPIRM